MPLIRFIVCATLLASSFTVFKAADAQSIDLFNSFTDTQGANGLSYLGFGDSRPINTTNPSQEIINLLFFSEPPEFFGAGPLFAQSDFFPHIQAAEEGYLLLHPEATPGGALGAAVAFTASESNTLLLSGDFARANAARNLGNGVEVGIYLNGDLLNPIFESSISSDHDVDLSNVFSGTSNVSFNEIVSVEAGDRVEFTVFTGPQGTDQGFDGTALRASITAVSEPIDLFSSFTDTQGANGLSYLGFGDSRPINTTNPSQEIINLLFFSEPPEFFGAGPLFAQSDFFPHIQAAEEGYLLLHPEATPGGALGAAVAFTASESNTLLLSGDFARANAARNLGNGVEVGIYLNGDLLNPIFESSISSDHDVDLSNVFSGTSNVSFNEIVSVEAGDRVEFTVFTGPQGTDQGFDGTALRASITTVPQPPILGDVNLDGAVNFFDIAPFIAVLSAQEFQAEADVDLNGEVNFFDIAPFIDILSKL